MKKDIQTFVNDQLSCWPMACANFRALKGVTVRKLMVGALEVQLQHNPARIISSAAKTDAASLKARPCFLCPENRPAEQIMMPFEGRKGKKYDFLVNPFPIFQTHLVIALEGHKEQSIWERYVDMLDMAKAYPEYTFFYNGPKCGASAPDHHHFQATRRSMMPLECDVDRELELLNSNPGNAREKAEGTVFEYLTAVQDAKLYHYGRFVNGIFVLKAHTSKSAAKMFYRFLDTVPVPEGDSEPRFNLITYCSKGEYISIIILRKCHRSHHYFSEGPDHLTMSPGCADMGGVFIASVREDYDKLTSAMLSEMLSEITPSDSEQEELIARLSRKQPQISVGIMSAEEIRFEIISDGAGVQNASFRDGRIDYNGNLFDELIFDARTLSSMFAEPSFILHNVEIGRGFHWERTETQTFAGSLRIIVENGKLTAINDVGVEDYLLSVISSEMKASASEEFLKAHAIISRSWVLRQLKEKEKDAKEMRESDSFVKVSDGRMEIRRWYNHEDHSNYHVCADDHCQRYQGLTRAVGKKVRKVIDETWGKVLTFGGEICDARFSKCCGGRMELFSTCWDDRDYPYLQSREDSIGDSGVFCRTDDRKILSQVLNDYDLETRDFHEWEQEISNEELAALIKEKSGCDMGHILSMNAIERGPSGRISKLEIRGSKNTLVVGKELEIRRLLSKSHLKSSNFTIEGKNEAEGAPSHFILRGKGWGHGVGLCQIGAAVMASKGYSHREILEHYYPGAEISLLADKIYK